MTELTTGEVAERTGLTARQLQHWVDGDAIRPSIRRAAGKGGWMGWSEGDAARLSAISQVLDDFAALGIHHITRSFVAHLWDHPGVDVVQGTVTIRLASEPM